MSGESFYKPNTMLDAMAQVGRLPGGCGDCSAYQTVEQVERGVYAMTVHHDSSCPEYRARVANRGGQS